MTKDWLFPFVRLEAIVSGVSAIITKVAYITITA